VRGLAHERDCVRVLAEADRNPIEYRGRIVIGRWCEFGSSRAIGNTLKDGVLAVSVRAYYRGVACDGARMKVYFDRDYFPGYGWLFVDDDDLPTSTRLRVRQEFPDDGQSRRLFPAFHRNGSCAMLAKGTRCGPVSADLPFLSAQIDRRGSRRADRRCPIRPIRSMAAEFTRRWKAPIVPPKPVAMR